MILWYTLTIHKTPGLWSSRLSRMCVALVTHLLAKGLKISSRCCLCRRNQTSTRKNARDPAGLPLWQTHWIQREFVIESTLISAHLQNLDQSATRIWLHTPHFALHAPHFTLYTPKFTSLGISLNPASFWISGRAIHMLYMWDLNPMSCNYAMLCSWTRIESRKTPTSAHLGLPGHRVASLELVSPRSSHGNGRERCERHEKASDLQGDVGLYHFTLLFFQTTWKMLKGRLQMD